MATNASSRHPFRTTLLAVAILLCLLSPLLADGGSVRYSVSADQEGNTARIAASLRSLGSPPALEFAEQLVAAQSLLLTEGDTSDYRALLPLLEVHYADLLPTEHALLSGVLAEIESEGYTFICDPKAATAGCSAMCTGGSCSCSGVCVCSCLFGAPVCTSVLDGPTLSYRGLAIFGVILGLLGALLIAYRSSR